LSPWLGCAVDPETAGVRRENVIYAEDNRIELYEAAAPVRQAGRTAVLAVIPERALVITDAGTVMRLTAPSLSQKDGLCKGERFADQPAAAVCTAILAAPDLALTSAHCIVSEETCRTLLFAFDYAYTASGTDSRIAVTSLHRCAAIVAIEADEKAGVDYAWVRLDPPALPPRAPAALNPTPRLAPGTKLTAVGAGQGVPLKVDPTANVVISGDAGSGFFTAAVDAFTGSSGMPLFDADMHVVGFLMQGQTDYVESGGCKVSRHIEKVCAECTKQGERIAYLRPALDALCAAGGFDAVACRDSCSAPAPDTASRPDQDAAVVAARSFNAVTSAGCSVEQDAPGRGLRGVWMLLLLSFVLFARKSTISGCFICGL
jgi:hypothetical protein